MNTYSRLVYRIKYVMCYLFFEDLSSMLFFFSHTVFSITIKESNGNAKLK